MTRNWKITTAERRAIRAYAARCEKLQPRQITLSVGERYNLADASKRSVNVYLVDTTPDWEESDLHDLWDFFARIGSVELDDTGRACVDFYVYRNNRDSELLTNVQAYVETVDGKPVLVKLAGTGSRSITRAEIESLMGT